MHGFTITRAIDAPVEHVFAVFTDFQNAAKRVPSIHGVEMLTDGPVARGTRFRETRRVYGRRTSAEMEIIRFEPGEGYVVECRSGETLFTSACMMEAYEGGTRVEVALTVETTSLLSRLRVAVVLPAMRREFERDFEALKSACELGARWAPT